MLHDIWDQTVNANVKAPYKNIDINTIQNASCTIKINGKSVQMNGYRHDDTNTADTILMEVPADCIEKVSAY